jgi:hypothetical protein
MPRLTVTLLDAHLDDLWEEYSNAVAALPTETTPTLLTA